MFGRAVREMNAAYTRFGSNVASHWPRSLRVKRVQGLPRVWEMTWSFAGPDGRATFEYITIEDELAIKWRRIGSHDIFRDP